ncbi:hypothetical protein BK720_01080 [Bacillus thuringiensis serovar brasilensis]|uniref:CPBP family intramembrane glutamic endopeptidase n=1 Tax=Bacillus cereus group TaxID=86661 RepID=UPI000A361BDC|nr:CPBP family intramembrane glutamic endopeptidase [Bacillus thuringiensis]MCU5031642.1 CPBP family intramembrane metalloprotease [Bacillus cereus]MRA74587.1 CPBP family intramembrane metalloprotease [Bacillus thuringiensis]MRA92450.1 CPBP family intramembrane metalloprotease [Bacillus thuringiensis]MRC54737.1 CPBP family intramembrane metalloprotease [Bacillus thuringiensis]OTX38940.1 hypothetical protein BK720_01080 [Bacillus thuringiensis serovar brasilensis]
MRNINIFFTKLTIPQFIFVMTILSFLLPALPSITLGGLNENPIEKSSIASQIINGSIVYPLLETIIYQPFLFWALRRNFFLKENDYLIILVSASIFGISHAFGIAYILYTMLLGLIFSYTYWIYEESDKKLFIFKRSFWIVFSIHSLHNLLTLCLK